ncbi:MAG: CGGC domain-containing protein [Bacteroidetes bacterium]|nr:CGGC domain-containing protein [Bacteroidota bacterium]MCL5026378.1 CGGC domain-containing protein [Chloroflexota bacterium]
MAKIGIIRCDEHSSSCAGFNCFPAIRNKTGQMTQYDDIELVGFDTCGGCGRNKADKIVARATKLKEKGAQIIHLGNCLVNACPWKGMFASTLQEQVGLPVVLKTH